MTPQQEYDILIAKRTEINERICSATGWDMSQALFNITDVNPVTSNSEWAFVNARILELEG